MQEEESTSPTLDGVQEGCLKQSEVLSLLSLKLTFASFLPSLFLPSTVQGEGKNHLGACSPYRGWAFGPVCHTLMGSREVSEFLRGSSMFCLLWPPCQAQPPDWGPIWVAGAGRCD